LARAGHSQFTRPRPVWSSRKWKKELELGLDGTNSPPQHLGLLKQLRLIVADLLARAAGLEDSG
jgi:hypothetical protein